MLESTGFPLRFVLKMRDAGLDKSIVSTKCIMVVVVVVVVVVPLQHIYNG